MAPPYRPLGAGLAGFVPAGVVRRRTAAVNRRVVHNPYRFRVLHPRPRTIPHPARPTHPNNLRPPAGPKHFTGPAGGGGGGGAAADMGGGGYGVPGTPGADPFGSFGNLLSKAQKSLIDPNSYATAVADSTYAAPLAELRRQIAGAPGETASHIADIANWYNQVGDQAHSATMANQVAANAAGQSTGNITKGIVEALGGGANAGAGSVGALGAIAASGILGQGANQHAFDTGRETNLQGEGAEQKTNERRRGDAMLAQLRSNLTGMLTERGATRAKAYGEGTQTRFGQLGQLQNMILGQSMAGPQLESARLGNVAARQNIAHNFILNQQERAKLNDFINQTGSGSNDVSSLSPGERAQLSGYLTSNLLNDRGQLTLSPGRVKSILKNRLFNIAGYGKGSAASQAMIEATMRELLTPGRLHNYDRHHHTAYSRGVGL